MEIEPERIDPQGRTFPPPMKPPSKWAMLLYGTIALVIGVALLIFFFWVVLIFVAIGALFMGINMIRNLFRGEKPMQNSQSSVKFYIGRTPPRD